MKSFKQAIKKEAQAKKQVKRAKKHQLKWLEIEITHRCTLSCLHCGSSCDSTPYYEQELSEQQIISFLQQIDKKYGATNIMLCFTGGEPLMRQDIYSIIAQATEMGYRVTMVSNGMLIDEKVVTLLAAAGLSTISISIDGLQETHNWARGNAKGFQKAINALELLSKSNHFHIVEAMSCINQRSLLELQQMEKIFKSIGVDHWRLTRVFPIGRALDYPELLLNGTQLDKLLDFIKTKRQQEPSFYSYSEEGYLGCDYDFEVRDDMQHCDAGVSILTLLANGDLTGCAAVDYSFVQGNILKDDPVEIWENRFKQFRDRNWMKQGICGKCDKFRYCRGDGMHLWKVDSVNPASCSWKLLSNKMS